ncbi:MAG: DinB family protein [Anaerolineae bacterium]|nr:DinB family protein [Anaerolineae bacterium]
MSDPILTWCKSVVTITPARWNSLVTSVPLELLTRPPAPGEWSALDCLQHLVEVERVSYPVRLKALLAGQPFPGFNPADSIKPPPTPALAVEFEELRRANLTLLDQITPADLDRQALHAEYGMVTMRQFLHHWAGHDLMHVVQAERALMQPFIQGCGPWVVNYTDHAVG